MEPRPRTSDWDADPPRPCLPGGNKPSRFSGNPLGVSCPLSSRRWLLLLAYRSFDCSSKFTSLLGDPEPPRSAGFTLRSPGAGRSCPACPADISQDSGGPAARVLLTRLARPVPADAELPGAHVPRPQPGQRLQHQPHHAQEVAGKWQPLRSLLSTVSSSYTGVTVGHLPDGTGRP